MATSPSHPSSQLVHMLSEMDAALADEIAKAQQLDRSGKIAVDGQLVSELSGQYVYTFSLDAPWEPADDTPLTIKLRGRTSIRATVVTASGTTLTIAADEPLPPEALAQITLVDDPVALLEKLRDVLKNTSEGSALLGSKSFSLVPGISAAGELPSVPADPPLNQSQRDAISLSLGSEVTYIIGPPGTGKTATLAAIAFALIEQGCSVLIAAHSNIAVDNAILKLASMGEKANLAALTQGRIIRYGTPQLNAVRDWDSVYPPKIVKHRGYDLERQRARLRADHSTVLEKLHVLTQHDEQLDAEWSTRRQTLSDQRERWQSQLEPLDRIERQRLASIDAELRRGAEATAQAERSKRSATQDLTTLVDLRARLDADHDRYLALVDEFMAQLTAAQRMSAFARLVKGANPKRLAERVAAAKQQVWNDERLLNENQHRTDDAHQAIFICDQELERLYAEQRDLMVRRQTPSDAALQIAELRAQLATCDHSLAAGDQQQRQRVTDNQAQYESLKRAAAALATQIATTDDQLRELEKRLLDEAQVVATTLTKTYVDTRLRERRFDVVILDEVSMAPLPTVYVAASHADRGVVVIGDPKQLPPIVQAKTAVAKDWLGRDLFEVAHVTLEGANASDGRSVLLNEQYRMHPLISIIARKHVYNSHLNDGNRTVPHDYSGVRPLPGKPLLLCDTSDAAPIMIQPGGRSRINMYHALCAVAIARQTLESLPLSTREPGEARVGIVTPYAKQAELIQRLIKTEGMEKDVRVGTVHRFQGLEYEAIIFDTVESPPLRTRSLFVGGGTGTPAQRLINVAVTRAQHKLILIAHTRHIFGVFDEGDTLRLAVADAQRAASMGSRDILSLFAASASMDPNQPPSHRLASFRMELLNEVDFFDCFLADVRTAKQSIFIFSPFVRTARTSQLTNDLTVTCSNGVRVVVVASKPDNRNQTVDDAARDALERAGVEFRTSPGMHEKVVLIDEKVVYFGSLNPLSHNATTELMQRVDSPDVARQVANFVRVDGRAGRAHWGDDFQIRTQELPRGDVCPHCGKQVYPKMGRNGAFYTCIGYPKCTYAQDVTEHHLSRVVALMNIQCDGCSAGPMRPRAQRKDLRLECVAPKPCDFRRKITVTS